MFANGARGGDRPAAAPEAADCPVTVEVVGKPGDSKGFVAIPRRRVTERGSSRLRSGFLCAAPVDGASARLPDAVMIHAIRAELRPVGAEWRRVDGSGAAWRFVRWFGGAVLRRALEGFRDVRLRRAAASPHRAGCPLGVEIAALGDRSRAVLEASRGGAAGRHVDVAVADTAAGAAGAAVPTVVLAEAPPLLSVPALDPLRHNPAGCHRARRDGVGALGPRERLPAGVRADRVVRPADRNRIRSLHHLEDVAAFHPDATARAATLVRLAALGAVVHLADGAPRMEALLGAELYGLMAGAPPDPDPVAREALGIRLRRAALREHSLRARARQLCAHAGVAPPPPPLVSVLLPTRRPELLPHALAGVARQTYPRIELVLGLHGDGFAGVDRRLAGLPMPATVVRTGSGRPLGAMLNDMAAAAGGTLLARMDDDDAYGREHLWDLVLAQEYSQAELVGKTTEFVYLAASNMTVQLHRERSEEHGLRSAGGAVLVSRKTLDRVGGFPCIPCSEDRGLHERILRDGGRRVYRTHGAGFVQIRHGRDHSWDEEDEWFIGRARRIWHGQNIDQVGIADMADSYMPWSFVPQPR